MFIHYLRHYCLLLILSFFSIASFADVYKWIDDEGQTHYSQQAPRNRPVDMIKTPPPPAIDPAIAQKEIDTLIEQQQGIYEQREEERQLARDEAENEEKREEYCTVNQHNLQEYMNNPGRRMIDADGNVSRPTEEERHNKIMDIKKRLSEHCQ